ncbi:hypothetical protein D779_1301 [Imhoffiella purpurea]|uniref:Uncharacterized protein n=1 Tax=Imhoffiella purpurea TaxID=1249627 RepID=W9V806_9GAMM|nr:hypothetical protein D779_1301 [Imhoffiella purpurea]
MLLVDSVRQGKQWRQMATLHALHPLVPRTIRHPRRERFARPLDRGDVKCPDRDRIPARALSPAGPLTLAPHNRTRIRSIIVRPSA